MRRGCRVRWIRKGSGAIATLNRQPFPGDDVAGLLGAVEGFERFL